MRTIARVCGAANTPARLASAESIAEWEIIANTRNTSLIKERVYRDSYDGDEGEGRNSRVVDALNEWYLLKCAYCERIYALDVDHYRPKAEVRGEDNELIREEGYYWLCYEWSNLIPACITCNRQGGKGSKLPYLVGGVQVTNPTFTAAGALDKTACAITNLSFRNELPALLNPEVDQHFENYFSFSNDSDLQGIRINGIDPDRRGEITIKLCNLNRPETRRDRMQNVIRPFINSVASLIDLNRKGSRTQIGFKRDIEVLLQKLYDDTNDITLTHTLLRKFIVASPVNFTNVVIPFLPDEQKEFVELAFINYAPL
jgi:hypothetical protein